MMVGGGQNMFTIPQYAALLNLYTSTKAWVQYSFVISQFSYTLYVAYIQNIRTSPVR